MSKLKFIFILVVIIAAVSVTTVAFIGSRHNSMLTHCKNNLRRLAQLSDPEIRSVIESGPDETTEFGKKFWLNLWKKEKTPGIKQTLIPLTCPFTGNEYRETADSIEYRGPRKLEFTFGEQKVTTFELAIAADKVGNHGNGNGGNVAILKITVRVERDERREVTTQIRVETCRETDPLWKKASEETIE